MTSPPDTNHQTTKSMLEDLYHHLRRSGGVEPPDPAPGPALLHFGDAAAEYRAAHDTVVVFDLSDRTLIEVTGPARGKFLHSYCSNDVVGLTPGGGCEAFVTSLKGRILGHVWIAVGEETIRLDSWPGAAEPLRAHLGKYAMLEDVELVDRTAEFAKLYVTGANAANVLGLTEVAPYGTRRLEAFGGPIDVQRTDWFGGPGFLLTVPADQAINAWNGLTFDDVQPAGSLAFEALRIESTLPWYGIDLTDEHLAQEAARTDRAISFTKGCYLGQEPIHRLHVMGHTNRELRSLAIEGDDVPEPGTPVVDGDKEVGTLTSVAVTPDDHRIVALGMVRTAANAPGHAVTVGGHPARIAG